MSRGKFITTAATLSLALLGFKSLPVRAEDAAKAIQWQPWTDSLFETAKKENKLVILDLEAVWCHWCHVMDEMTYSDEKVKSLIGSKYIAVRVDQDSRPDLSNRYEDYGWPATIVFSPSGQELVKRSGYIPPGPMASMLQTVIDDPTPGPSAGPEEKIQYAEKGTLGDDLRKTLQEDFHESYDEENGGWGTIHKFLDPDCVQYAMTLAAAGDAQALGMAQKTLDENLALIDPAWGGVYQYSVGGHWSEPHFEKIMSYQANDMRIYAEAYALWKRPADLKAAKDIHRFLSTFLWNPDGAFYTSQDADLVRGQHGDDFFKLPDDERRKKGLPVIDKNMYARENGWAIEALAALYSVTKDPAVLDQAQEAARWVIAHRSLEKGGFRHDEVDKAGPYLGDTLAIARAFLSLYTVTANREWLSKAMESADYMSTKFKADPAGYITAYSATAGFTPKPQKDENVSLARFANLLFRYTGKDAYKQMADHAMRYLSTPAIAERSPTASVLLTEAELAKDPTHITLLGSKKDETANALFMTALAAYPLGYKRVEWWDRSEGPLVNPDVQYPELPKAAAFLCADQRCSLPLFTVERLQARINAPK